MTQENFYKRIEMGESCIDDLKKEISALKSRVNDLTAKNASLLRGFEIKMQDSPPEFAQALQDNFWDLAE